MSGWYTVQNPLLEEPWLRPQIKPREEVTVFDRRGGLDFDFLDKVDQTESAQVVRGWYQQALELADKVEERGKGYTKRARTRWAIANYLRTYVYPATFNAEYRELAQKLEDARPWAIYGVDVDEKLVIEWAQRAGLVKLCPDDAREEGMRVGQIYEPRIRELQEQGYELHFAVFTLPNAARWHLGACMDSIFDRLRCTITHARVDGRIARNLSDAKRVFPDLVGALATLEAPLSARGDWNVHVNVLMVFKGRPDYGALRDAWGANVEFRWVPTGAGGAAIRELVKYTLKATSEKSIDKRRATEAPPLIEWPPDAFDEWWRAHKGFRRTRSWGLLYSGKIEKPARDPERPIDWIGKIKNTPSRFVVSRPMPDTRAWDLRQRAPSRVDSILGNISAGTDPPISTSPADREAH